MWVWPAWGDVGWAIRHRAAGQQMVVPRTQAHLRFMIAKYGAAYFYTAPGISRPAHSSNNNYNNQQMRYGYSEKVRDWKAVDGGSW